MLHHTGGVTNKKIQGSPLWGIIFPLFQNIPPPPPLLLHLGLDSLENILRFPLWCCIFPMCKNNPPLPPALIYLGVDFVGWGQSKVTHLLP